MRCDRGSEPEKKKFYNSIQSLVGAITAAECWVGNKNKKDARLVEQKLTREWGTISAFYTVLGHYGHK